MSWRPAFEPAHPLSFEEATQRLHAAQRFGIDPRLEAVEDMLAELGSPDLAYACVQIAGTNGKTSTSRYTAAILAGEGLRVGLYTSPELVHITERIEVDGHPVPKDVFARGLTLAFEAAERVNAARTTAGERAYDITEFTLLTVAALTIFAEAGVEVAVLECGMGGRWDATSAARLIRAVAITGIGLDHTRILGSTLTEIAAEKAAIIQRGRACVLGAGTLEPPEVAEVFRARCAEQEVVPVQVRAAKNNVRTAAGPQVSFAVKQLPATLGDELVFDVDFSSAHYHDLCVCKPAYQAANIACALALASAFLERPLNLECLRTALSACPTPGRFEVVRREPLVLVDACHNPQSVQVFLDEVRRLVPQVAHRPTLLVAILADKDVRGIVELLVGEFPQVIACQTQSPRALAASELAALFAEAGQMPVASYSSVTAALAACSNIDIVAAGSITLAGEVAAHFRR